MPLIYLIPEDYFGPVVGLFEQPDGVEPVRTPEGLVVRVPDNGIIKIKGKYKLGHSEAFPKSTVVFMLEKKDGTHQPLLEAINPWQDFDKENRPWMVGIRNVQGELQVFPTLDNAWVYDLFPQSDQNKPMVFWHDSCVDRVFGPEWQAYEAGRKDADDLNIPQCGEFVVGKYNEIKSWPEWMFLRGKGRHEKSGKRSAIYESVQELIDEANVRLSRKRQFVIDQKKNPD